MQFSGNSMQKRVNSAQRSNKPDWTIPWTVQPDFELFCALKMWRYRCILLFWSFAVVLTERTMSLWGLNKLFLHLVRALCWNIRMMDQVSGGSNGNVPHRPPDPYYYYFTILEYLVICCWPCSIDTFDFIFGCFFGYFCCCFSEILR